jgi:tRNA pseudouridine38-40 synthase
MTRYRFRIEYDGTAYVGWQSQPNGPSVQQNLEQAFSTVVRHPCRITGAGRTDAGVHARGQAAHVDLPDRLDVAGCRTSVNGVLPPDIAIYDLEPVSPDFHARYSARSRRYVYSIVQRKTPLLSKRAWMVFYPVDWKLLESNLGQCLGKHDFTTCCCVDTATENMSCAVSRAELEHQGNVVRILLEADRFVYRMVRSVVGTLVDIARGRFHCSMSEILEARDRKAAGQTAPAFGLVLDHVAYDEE